MESVRLRQDIVDAATDVFSTLGYHRASMQDVADAVGMRKASLYHHVRKKEDLLFAIHEDLIDELVAQTTEALNGETTPSEKLAAAMHAAMRFIGANRGAVRVFLQEFGAVSGDRWDVIVGKRDRYEAMVRDVIREGVAAGEFVDLPDKIVARGILAMSNWSYTWFSSSGPMSADDVADVFAKMVISGLAVKSRQNQPT